MLKFLVPCLAFAALAIGCATAPVTDTSAPIVTQDKFIDYSKVKPVNHEALAVGYANGALRESLMDPNGMRLDTTETPNSLKLGICQNDANNQTNRYKIWATSVTINATNAYGEYTGPRRHTLFFNEGEVIASEEGDISDFDDKPIAGGFYFPCRAVR